MRQQADRAPGDRHEEGVALVVVLLFTAIILMAVVSTTATLALGARGGGVDERGAYQALLVAESGQNTFAARVGSLARTSPYTGTRTSELTAWLGTLGTYSLGTAGTAELSLLNVTPKTTGATFTLRSQGSAPGAAKVVVQDYVVTNARLPRTFRSRAGLTSLPAIDASNGNQRTEGRANDGVATRVRSGGTPLSLPALQPGVTLPVEDTGAVLVGDYVRVNGATFRVDGKEEASLSLVRVLPTSPTAPLTLSGDVTVMLNAVAQTSPTVGNPGDLRVSNAGDFLVGEELTIAGKAATVQAVDAGNGTVRLGWPSGAPASLPEGTQVFRDVTGMRSAADITAKSNKLDDISMTSGGQTTNDCTTSTLCAGERDPLLASPTPGNPSDPFFTEQLFGLSDEELNDLVPLDNDPTLPQGEIKRVSAADFDRIFSGNARGSGVLIVDGDINSNINGNVTFDGMIYIRGNQGGKFNGNMTLNGAIAVRGGPIEGITTDDTTTQATGSLLINYDAVSLRSQLLNARGVFRVQTEPGTWRQQ
ncbi:pilus assembly PilX N-terminal domain-containing protein [Deinococcus planocerae]|uniref:pilus assembly PilX N-terminal domain-containing protein n=1 Tax=Deinococcus planocerae TaxID=1737569 RepID=UPI0011AF96D3|nr:pilus assembly PilX N-terminal domain-containing protein [Deinococcus planocerae]